MELYHAGHLSSDSSSSDGEVEISLLAAHTQKPRQFSSFTKSLFDAQCSSKHEGLKVEECESKRPSFMTTMLQSTQAFTFDNRKLERASRETRRYFESRLLSPSRVSGRRA